MNDLEMMITVEEASRLYAENDAAHDFDHVLRVLALAERIGQAEGADLEIVQAAALLHDVGGRYRSRHARVGAQRAREILQGHPPEKVEAVAQAIATHSFREKSTPQTLEARVLYDADKLDGKHASSFLNTSNDYGIEPFGLYVLFHHLHALRRI